MVFFLVAFVTAFCQVYANHAIAVKAMQCYEGKAIWLYCQDGLQHLGHPLQFHNLGLWNMVHETGAGGFEELLQVDDPLLRRLIQAVRAAITRAA